MLLIPLGNAFFFIFLLNKVEHFFDGERINFRRDRLGDDVGVTPNKSVAQEEANLMHSL